MNNTYPGVFPESYTNPYCATIRIHELSNNERCWYVDICDRGAFRKYRTSAATEVFLKSAEITNIYIHSRVRYDLYHMSLDRTNVDSIDRPNFDLLKWFFDSSSDEEKNGKIKSFIEASRANRDVRVWYKQCIPRKWCTLALTLKGYLGIWY